MQEHCTMQWAIHCNTRLRMYSYVKCVLNYILNITINSLNGMYWIWFYIEKNEKFYCYSIWFYSFRCPNYSRCPLICIFLLYILKDWLSYFYRSQLSICKIVEDFNVDRFVIYLLNNMFRPLIVRNLM